MQPAMRTVPPPIGSARPSRAPSAPAARTPSSPAPSDTAKTAPTVGSLRRAWVTPIRPLMPHRAFCARDQNTMAPARTGPERRYGSRPVPGAARGATGAGPGSRGGRGHTVSAVRAMAASVRPWPGRWGTVRYTTPASADTLSRPRVEPRCGSGSAAIRVAATVVAVPEPNPPITAPATTARTAEVSAAPPYPSTARARPSRARVRAPKRSTRAASRKPARAELSSSALPTAPTWVGDRSSPRSSRPTVVGSRYGARYPAVKRATRGRGVVRGANTGVPGACEGDGTKGEVGATAVDGQERAGNLYQAEEAIREDHWSDPRHIWFADRVAG